MVLEHAINWNIMNYPTLFRCSNHKESRLRVLEHFFLTVGSGLEWSKDGYLYDYMEKDPQKRVVKKLPKDFYQLKLWQFTIDPEMLKDFKEEFKAKKIYYYIRNNYFGTYIIFSGTKEEVLPIVKKYETDTEKEYRKRLDVVVEGVGTFFHSYIQEAKATPCFIPYAISNLSPIAELIAGKTHNMRNKAVDLSSIKEDWMKGALELIKATLEFYKDPEQYKNSSSHPSRSLFHFEDALKEDPKGFFERNVLRGLPPEATPKEASEAYFKKYKEEQIEWCERFLQKFT